jgi:DNA-binding MarR family transcriptional regulator
MEKKLVDLIIELKKDCMIDEEQIRTLCNVSLAEYKAVMEIKTMSPSRGSRIIDGLVRKGYLLRATNPEDRRSFVLSLSTKGVKIKDDIERERNNCEKRIREKLSTKEFNRIKEGLELVTKIFHQE